MLTLAHLAKQAGWYTLRISLLWESMPAGDNDFKLLEIQASTVFVIGDSGRLVHMNNPSQAAAPRLYFSGCAEGSVVRLRDDVSEETAQAIERLAAKEHDLGYPRSVPVHLDEYVKLLSAEMPIERYDLGSIWTFSGSPGGEHPAVLVDSDTPSGKDLLDRFAAHGLPESLRSLGFASHDELWAPFCIAFHGEEPASVAFTVGSTPDSAEVGVVTIPEFRGQGYAAAVTAGWASLQAHDGRTLFYCTYWTNVSSQRVTQRLGLRFIGTSLTIT